MTWKGNRSLAVPQIFIVSLKKKSMVVLPCIFYIAFYCSQKNWILKNKLSVNIANICLCYKDRPLSILYWKILSCAGPLPASAPKPGKHGAREREAVLCTCSITTALTLNTSPSLWWDWQRAWWASWRKWAAECVISHKQLLWEKRHNFLGSWV